MPLVLATTWLFSVAACGAYLRLARHWQILDRPNCRSSHALPTPHGGGMPLLLALGAGVGAAAAAGAHWESEVLELLALAALLGALGVLDDLRGLPVTLRFGLYALCCLLAVAVVFGAPLAWRGTTLLVAPLAVLALLWLLNLYNFMDGIDGLAATQCVLACCVAAWLAYSRGSGLQYPLLCLLLAAAQGGFLVWNWPPARLFMGDAGSVPTGFLLGVLALLGAQRGVLPLACWLILLAAFITDATVTLFWRMATGQPFTRPHRLHAYQRLSRALQGHLPVVLILIGLHLLWLIPLASLAAFLPKYAAMLVILAYIPLLLAMAYAFKLR